MRVQRSGMLLLSVCCCVRALPVHAAGQPSTGPTTIATSSPSSTTAPADTLAMQRQSNQQQDAREAADYPLLPSTPLDQLLQFRLEKNQLAVLTRLPPTAGKSHVIVTDLPGICTIDVHSLSADPVAPAQPYRPSIYMFERHDYARPQAVDANTTVSITPMNLQISQDVETLGGGMRQVSLVQTSPAFVDPGEPAIRLRVTITAAASPPSPAGTDTPDVNLTCGASDFVTLRRLYRAQTARYLQPIFRELHAEADLFNADPRLAWEVFAADASPDPALTARLQHLVADLDSDTYRTRQSAATELNRLGQPAAVALQHMDRSHWSPEQNSRIEAFLSTYHPVSTAEADHLRNDPDFLLDCLYLDDPFIIRAALARLRQVTHRAVTFDSALRAEPRRDAITSLRDELTTTPTTAPTPQPG